VFLRWSTSKTASVGQEACPEGWRIPVAMITAASSTSRWSPGALRSQGKGTSADGPFKGPSSDHRLCRWPLIFKEFFGTWATFWQRQKSSSRANGGVLSPVGGGREAARPPAATSQGGPHPTGSRPGVVAVRYTPLRPRASQGRGGWRLAGGAPGHRQSGDRTATSPRRARDTPGARRGAGG
jgi:hypothetical protein